MGVGDPATRPAHLARASGRLWPTARSDGLLPRVGDDGDDTIYGAEGTDAYIYGAALPREQTLLRSAS